MRSLPTLALVTLLLGSSCHRDESRPLSVGPHRAAQNEAECRACSGEWGLHGLAQTVSCLCRTRDAGKPCKDGLDCEGECEVLEGKVEVTDRGPPARGYFLGRCSDLDHLFGCHKLLVDGTANRGPVILDEPLPEMCID